MNSLFQINNQSLQAIQKLDKETKSYVQELKGGSNNILVAIRNRPLSQKEFAQTEFETIRILNSQVVVLLDPGNEFQPEDAFRKNRNKETQFAFDFAFNKDATNEEIYQKACGFLIEGVLGGFNATVFAFGATGAGKTYTMVGNNESPGMIQQATNELFSKMTMNVGANYVLKVSYLEIYNETLHDLLTIEDQILEMREDPNHGIIISGLTEITTTTLEEVNMMIKIGNKNRIKEATSANNESSRSHAVLQIIVEQRENIGVEEIQFGKLVLVDLAGSERAANTSNRGLRLFEGAKINQSLLELGNCIQSLAESHEKKKYTYINYRGSKLTRLLKDSLSGNCRTVMIANVSPSVHAFEDTYNTLNYANRAKNIKTNSKRNVLNVDNHIEGYQSVIEVLKVENEALKKSLQNIKNQYPKNLPVLQPQQQSNPSQALDSLEAQIRSHFDDELDIKQKYQSVDYKIEKLNFQIQSKLAELKLNKESPQDRLNQTEIIDGLKSQMTAMTKSKDDLLSQYHELLKERSQIQTVIKQNQTLSELNQNYLLTLFRQNQLIIVPYFIYLIFDRKIVIFSTKKINKQITHQLNNFRYNFQQNNQTLGIIQQMIRKKYYKSNESLIQLYLNILNQKLLINMKNKILYFCQRSLHLKINLQQ